jgi:hypothetical protein
VQQMRKTSSRKLLSIKYRKEDSDMQNLQTAFSSESRTRKDVANDGNTQVK